MQPPRPFQGLPYDKDMFTFLPALANRDVMVESPRKRKSMASDSHITIDTPTMGYDPFGNQIPKDNARHFHTGEQQRFIPASPPRELSSYRAKFGHQNDSGAPWHSNESDFYKYESVSHGNSSFAGQFKSSNYNDSPSLIQSSSGLTYESSNWSPLVTKDFNQHGSLDSSSRVGGEENSSHFPKTQSYGLQVPNLTKIEGPNSNELVLGESQNLQQNFSAPGAYIVGSNEDHCHEHSDKAESFTKIEGVGDSSSYKTIDPSKMLGSNGISMHNLGEANRILQQALRLIRASSGTSLNLTQDGSSQGSGGDITKIKSTPTSQFQNLTSIDDTPSKGSEAGFNLDKSVISKFSISDDKSSVNVGNGLKSEYGGLALAEKLWEGTLQLSYSVSVSAVAFFKSGDRMHDFSWSGSVEVKGKVRLEAFEKYVQDLPRSRSRGLMVMSLWGKDGSSSASHKSMTEVARKYREGKRVGFAQLNKGLDMYICPHSDTVITILAKHGFFKGMTAVAEKSDTLISCVVWRKNSSLSKQSGGNSEQIQTEIGQEKNSPENKSPELCVDQPEQPMIPENKQLSEINSHIESIKPNSSVLSVPNQSLVLSDDEDLPEYDFEVVTSQTSERKSSETRAVGPTPKMEQVKEANQHISGQKRSESFTVSQTLPDPRLQGPPQNMNYQPEAHNPNVLSQQENQSGEIKIGSRTSIQGPPQKMNYQPEAHNLNVLSHKENQSGEMKIGSKTSIQGLDPQYMGNQHEKTIPNWPIEEKKLVDCTVTVKPKNIFDDDDDDMPEWCPPGFKKTMPEVNERPGPGPSMIPRFSFTDLATGRQLPSPAPLPPLPPPPSMTQVQLLDKKNPTENRLSLPLPPPPPRPPPPHPISTQGQFFDKSYPSPHFPNPAVNALVHENRDTNKTSMHYNGPASSSLMQFQANQYPPPVNALMHEKRDANKTSMHNSGPAPSSHMQFQANQCTPPVNALMHEKRDANKTSMHNSGPASSSHMQFQSNQYTPPVNALMHENRDTDKTSMHNSGPASSSHMQFQANQYPPPVNELMHEDRDANKTSMHNCGLASSSPMQFQANQYPPPVNELMHENRDANKTSMHNSGPAPSSHMQFQANQYPPPGHLPRPPPPLPPTPPPPLYRPKFPDENRSASHFSNAAVHDFMKSRPGTPSSHVKFQYQHYPPALPLPPGMPETTNFNNFTPNSGFRPQFHGAGMNNQARPSAWRGPRP